MKEKIDLLLENAFNEKFEPDKRLNEKILNEKNSSMKSFNVESEKILEFKKKSFMDSFAKVAVVVFCVGSIGAFGLFATTKIGPSSKNSKVSKDVGLVETTSESLKETDETVQETTTEEEVDYSPDEESIKEWNELKNTIDLSDSWVSSRDGKDGDNWLSRDLLILDDGYANIRYNYDDYGKALIDSGLYSMFTKDYQVGEYGVTYTDILNIGNKNEGLYRILDTWFDYKKGKVYCSQIYQDCVSDDYSFSSGSKGRHNERLYTNKDGCVFKLEDVDNDAVNLFDEKWETATETLFVSMNNKTSYQITFYGLSEEEMHEFLDTVIIPNYDLTDAPKSEDRDKIIKEIKKNKTK